MANLIERALSQEIDDDQDDHYYNFDDQDLVNEVYDLLLIEVDPVSFDKGDYKNIKKQIGDKIFNSCLLILIYSLFLYRLSWTVPDVFNGQFSRTEFMISGIVAVVYLFLRLLLQLILLQNDMRLYVNPQKIVNESMLRLQRNILNVFDTIHHTCLWTFLMIYPLVWLLKCFGL